MVIIGRCGHMGGVCMKNERNFQLRFQCDNQGKDNEISDLRVEQLVDGEWKNFELGFQTQGFLIFVYAILNCQHQYLRRTANERQLQVEATRGSIEMITNEGWEMQSLRLRYRVKLRSGEPTADDADHILSGMQMCPVSTNLAHIVSSDTMLEFELNEEDQTPQHHAA